MKRDRILLWALVAVLLGLSYVIHRQGQVIDFQRDLIRALYDYAVTHCQ